MTEERGTLENIIVIIIWLMIIGGWVANIVKLVTYAVSQGGVFGMTELLRVAGIFVYPLGAVMGYL